MISAQDECGAAPLGEVAQRQDHFISCKPAVVFFLGIARIPDEGLVFCVRETALRGTPEGMVQGEISGDPEEVSLRGAFRIQTVSRLPESEECLLRKIFCCLAVAGVAIEKTEDSGLHDKED